MLLQSLRELHVQSLALCANGRLLQLRLWSHGKRVNDVLQSRLGVDLERPRLSAAHGAVVLFLVLKRICVDAVIARIHHVVVLESETRSRRGRNLEGFVAARGRDDGVCRRNGGDNVLYGALRQRVGDAGDIEFLRSCESFVVQPGDVLRVVLVELGKRLLLVPGDDVRPLDAVFRLAGDGGNSAERNRGSRRVHVELALDARGDGGEDDARLALEALCAAVDERLDAVRVARLFGHGDEHGVDPAASLDAVEAADDELELAVEGLVKVLDARVVRCDGDALDAVLDKLGRYFGLVLAHVCLAEEELSVQVGDVNGIWRAMNAMSAGFAKYGAGTEADVGEHPPMSIT